MASNFYREKLTKILTEKQAVLDIGGGLRAREGGDRYDPTQSWLHELLAHVDYKIMNPVANHGQEIVGDIHKMPFADNSQDAIICAAVLEHVENPILAAQEMFRTLKPGGYLWVYVPFLYYYHTPESGLYGDYWRFTEDALRSMFRNFSSIEIEPVRGAIETWFHLNPMTQRFESLGRMLDRMLGKDAHHTKQVSGYAAFLIK